MKKSLRFITIFICFGMTLAAADKVRVSVNNANVRLQPSLTGEIVLKAGAGDEFEVLAASNGWFKIRLPETSGSKISEGFISAAVVELLASSKTPAERVPQPASAKSPARSPRPATAAKHVGSDANRLFSGLFSKFGYRNKPAGNFGDRWLLSLGKDWGINPYLAAGAEIQPYYRHFSSGDFSDSTLGANLFINAKGGVNIGRFAEKLKFLTPYAGVGLGGAFAYSSSSFDAAKDSRADFHFAWHLMFGLEVVLKNLSVILEIQTIKISVAETSPDAAQHFFMLGVRF
jgi:opacity protein-like surface antigen